MTSKPLVLLIEDDDSVRRLVRVLFERHGWAVIEARDGDDALELVEKNKVKLIVLDLGLPVLDGYGFLDCLIESEKRAVIPVILLTGADLNAADKTRFKGRVALMIEKASGPDGMLAQVETVARAYRDA